jgi:hypothetical protein
MSKRWSSESGNGQSITRLSNQTESHHFVREEKKKLTTMMAGKVVVSVSKNTRCFTNV